MSTAAAEEQKLVLHTSCHCNLKVDFTNCAALSGWLHREKNIFATSSYFLAVSQGKSGCGKLCVPQLTTQLDRTRVRVELYCTAKWRFLCITYWRYLYFRPPLFKYLIHLQRWKIALIHKLVWFCYSEKIYHLHWPDLQKHLGATDLFRFCICICCLLHNCYPYC